MNTNACAKPCPGCPFARATPPGEIGGSSPLVYLGQAAGPYYLPCHNSPGYAENRRSFDHLQCAGAAIFRTHIEADVPGSLARLPEDKAAVFSSAAEFLAYHKQAPIEMAEAFLRHMTLEDLLRQQLQRPTNTIHITPN